jgi:hypothetical protein
MHPPAAGPPAPTAGLGRDGMEAFLERAAWFGHPGDGVAALDGVDPDGPVTERVRWLAGVCLGALGRYRRAARWLAPGGAPAGSLAASCLASHLRQVGRHAEAEPLDRLALTTATDAEARADALVGLVADAVGRHDLALARARLTQARDELTLPLDPLVPAPNQPGPAGSPASDPLGPAPDQPGPAGDPLEPAGNRERGSAAGGEVLAVTNGDAAWRVSVRLAWVTAEIALLAGEPEIAVEAGRTAHQISRTAAACRHTVKSQLVLGVALDAAGRTRPATRVLRAAARGSVQLGLTPLLRPTHQVLAGILHAHAPTIAERERLRARTAERISEDPAGSGNLG